MEHTYSTSMQAYVLSLRDAAERRESIERQLSNFPYSWEFFDAIDLRSVSEIPDDLYSVERSGLHGRRRLTKGEVGCSASHRAIYQKILDDNVQWALVLEDDAILSPGLADFVADFMRRVKGEIDCFIVGYSKLSKDRESSFYKFEPIQPIGKIGSFAYGRVWRNWTCGTVGYFISRKGAKKMLRSPSVETLADDWNFFSNTRELEIAHVRPLLVSEDFSSFASSLELERSALTSRYDARLDFLRLLRGAVRRAIMFFRYFPAK